MASAFALILAPEKAKEFLSEFGIDEIDYQPPQEGVNLAKFADLRKQADERNK